MAPVGRAAVAPPQMRPPQMMPGPPTGMMQGKLNPLNNDSAFYSLASVQFLYLLCVLF